SRSAVAGNASDRPMRGAPHGHPPTDTRREVADPMRQRSGGIRRSVAAVALAGLMSTLGSGLALAQTASPAPAAPPAGLTITTTYPSIAVDPGGTATLPLQVTSPVVERVDLSVSGAPEGYEATFRGGGLIV